MIPAFSRWLVVLAAVSLLAACGMAVRPQQEFESVFRSYAEQLRWGDYRAVAGYLADPYRQEFLRRFSTLDDLHVVDVRLDSVDFEEEGRRAQTSTLIEYYQLPSLTVEKARLRQEWIYQGGDRYHPGAWQLAGPFPAFP